MSIFYFDIHTFFQFTQKFFATMTPSSSFNLEINPMETNEILLDESYPAVEANDITANLYSSGSMHVNNVSSEAVASSGHLFIWITLTMVWVLMILAIMALLKYVTHEDRKPRAKTK